MRRLAPADRLLLLVLLPLWGAAFVLHVGEIRRTGAVQVPVFAAPPRGDDPYPRVGGFRLERQSAGTGLEVGDRLLRVGDADLRGAGYFRFDAITFDEAGEALEAPLVFERAGERRETRLRLRVSAAPWARVPLSLALAGIAVLVLLRAPGTRASRFFFVAALGMAITETPFEGGPRLQTYAAYAAFHLVGPAALYCLIRWLILFPDEVARRDRPTTAWAWVALLFPLVRLNYVLGGPVQTELVPQVVVVTDLVLFATCLGILTWNAVKADPIGRRRIKWVALGGYLSMLPVVLNLAAPIVLGDPGRYEQLLNASLLLGVLFPLGVLVGILRCRLFDIDRILSTTVAYSALAALFIGAVATVVPRLAQALSAALSLDPQTGQTAVSAVLAAVAVPGYRWLRPQVDRVIFAERHALETGVRELLGELSSCAGPEELLQRVGERLAGILRPETCSLFWRVDAEYVPIFVRGQSMPPAFPAGSPLVAALAPAEDVVVADRGQRGGRGAELGPFERAALETLGVAVVVPLRSGAELVGFLCLGIKGSGDIYTPTDLVLFAAVGEKASSELLRFADAATIRHERALQSELRQYVPEAVAERIESGGDVEAGEREVSVLFVDIRGYTSYSEQRDAGEVFSVINRYTERVSSLVREHGGSVLEFHGDGLMAVFGAPAALPEKERAAVQAACVIVESMAAERQSDDREPLSVGVGVATGLAFVGNIRSVDRMIWTAIGSTVNLAARLQGLSRELEASVVIDHDTWRRAGPARRGFELRAETRIRGMSRAADVHALPIEI
ncbi:MAG: adenylate/guanylate cyclase domain-containing protein [Myxococcota bacterium]|nr:adenylate/guanylate cyclase domain-containing protein [Myxococcota bacterium]